MNLWDILILLNKCLLQTPLKTILRRQQYLIVFKGQFFIHVQQKVKKVKTGFHDSSDIYI